MSEEEEEVGKKYDQGKLRYDLLPPLALEEVVKVLTFGASKYGTHTWHAVPNGAARYFAACQRHLWAWMKGEDRDPESGIHHLSHAATNCLFLISLVGQRGSKK